MSSTENKLQRRRIIYVRPFDGEIRDGDLQLITDDLKTDLVENGRKTVRYKSLQFIHLLNLKKSSARQSTLASMLA